MKGSAVRDTWLTVEQAAQRLGVTERTVRRYVARDGMQQLLGRVREKDLIEHEAAARARARAGRPRSSGRDGDPQ